LLVAGAWALDAAVSVFSGFAAAETSFSAGLLAGTEATESGAEVGLLRQDA
jgi:hypothetical protein